MMKTAECSIEVKTNAGKIIQAFTDEKMLKNWWGVEKTFIELKPGGVYCIAWFVSVDGIKYISTGIIREYDTKSKLHVGDYMYLSPERPFLGPLNLMVGATETRNGGLLQLQQGPYPEGRGED